MRWLAALLLAVVLSWPWLARAADKDPLDYPIRQYGLMLGVALLGGLVSWWAKVRKGEAKAWHISGLVGELCTSAFAGLLAFWLCEWAATPPLLTASLVGIAGHMGTRAISAFEEFAQKRYGAKHD
jgi:peptidoglycan/LPS O-acetylase OafA/YrhL